jgi:hypothetical protein
MELIHFVIKAIYLFYFRNSGMTGNTKGCQQLINKEILKKLVNE